MSKNINTKPLSGFMELKPAEQILFNTIKDIIEENYKLYGFIPMDNPILERKETLLAKAGGETEKQIYSFKKGDTDLAMRFDLTVPLARYVVDKYGDIVFPFKRYQIAKVYRGERAQAGRFREFYQADIDVIGDEILDLSFDAEVPAVAVDIFQALGFDNFTIRINNRKILNGLFEALDLKEKSQQVMQIIDKLEKIGQDGVREELGSIGVDDNSQKRLFEFLNISGSNGEKIESLKNLDIKSDIFAEGVSELEKVINIMLALGVEERFFEIDLTIARGLDYYTGTVYETRLDDYPEIGSVCSGGRYENLASAYTDKKLPGVGISIGLSRLFDQLIKKSVISPKSATYTKVAILPLDIAQQDYALKLAKKLRDNDISTEILLNFNKKMQKRMKYADRLSIPFVVIVGEEEEKGNQYTLKNLATGKQDILDFDALLQKLSE